MKIEWKKVITGVILAIILMFIIALVTVSTLFGFFGFVIAIMYVGYSVGGDLKNGIVNGTVSGMIFIIIAMSFLVFVSGYMGINLTANYILSGVTGGLIVSVGCSLLGSLIRMLRSSESDPSN
ncbi:MAG: DUF5518 domain-containing protein [Methanobacterium formicicum]